MSKDSASLRLCGRINLVHRETLIGRCPWHRTVWQLVWGGESPAETRRRGDISKNSASLRLCGRTNLVHRAALLGRCPWHRPVWQVVWGGESPAETRRRGEIGKDSASLRLCGRTNLVHRATLLGRCPWHRQLWELVWGGESPAETLRRGGMGSNPLRLSGRINLMHRETPNPRVSRRKSLDLQPCEPRRAACQHAIVTDGHEPRLGHPHACLLRVFVCSCEPCPASSLTGSPNGTSFLSREDQGQSRPWLMGSVKPARAANLRLHGWPRSHEEILLGPRSGTAA